MILMCILSESRHVSPWVVMEQFFWMVGFGHGLLPPYRQSIGLKRFVLFQLFFYGNNNIRKEQLVSYWCSVVSPRAAAAVSLCVRPASLPLPPGPTGGIPDATHHFVPEWVLCLWYFCTPLVSYANVAIDKRPQDNCHRPTIFHSVIRLPPLRKPWWDWLFPLNLLRKIPHAIFLSEYQPFIYLPL